MKLDVSRAALPRLSFVTGHMAGFDAEAIAAGFAGTHNNGVVRPLDGKIEKSFEARGGYALIVDAGHWRTRSGSPDQPTELYDGLPILSLEQWANAVGKSTGAQAILSPSLHVDAGCWDVLSAVLSASSSASNPEVVALLPLHASFLDAVNRSRLIDVVQQSGCGTIAFTFTGTGPPLANKERLRGLRELITALRKPWVLGVDPLVAADALAYGAEMVGVGCSASRRHPASPGQGQRKGFSVGWLPGMFDSVLLEFRSPRVYADWYANSSSGPCAKCGLDPDGLVGVDAHRQAVFVHNIHATHDFIDDLTLRPLAAQRNYLYQRRLLALEAHLSLTPMSATVALDPTLRALCELDDPRERRLAGHGAWT